MPITTLIPNATKRLNPYGVDLTSATIKIALFTSAASGGMVAGATLYSGLSNEVSNSGTNYTTGGNTIASLAWSGTTSPIITGTIPSWTTATFTFRYSVIYDTATSKIIQITDYGTDQTVTNGTLTLSFDTNGLIQVTSS